ncbi:MAG: DUF4129 domain-containing protein [Pseudomonadota bacterium]
MIRPFACLLTLLLTVFAIPSFGAPVSLDSTTARHALNPALLDEILDGLELEELSKLDRAKLALRLLIEDFQNWLRKISRDEDSFLHKFADLLDGIGGYAPSWNTIDFLLIAIPTLIFAIAFIWAALHLWRNRLPPEDPSVLLPAFRAEHPGTSREEITALPLPQQPGAIFRFACELLAAQKLLHLKPSETNSALARAANLDSQSQRRLLKLARAADLAVFGGWSPSSEDVLDLEAELNLMVQGDRST